jgi:sarcosine oxidase/L-pipecolate oxidase
MSARDALNAVGAELRRLGVKTSFGTCGTAASFELSTDGTQCTGVKAIDGTIWSADFVVVAAGAWTPSLVDLEGQTTAKVRKAYIVSVS